MSSWEGRGLELGVHSDKPSGPEALDSLASVCPMLVLLDPLLQHREVSESLLLWFPFPIRSKEWLLWFSEKGNVMKKLLPVNKHNKGRKIQMPQNILYKKIFMHSSFYKFMSRRTAWGTPLPLTQHVPGMPSWFHSAYSWTDPSFHETEMTSSLWNFPRWFCSLLKD